MPDPTPPVPDERARGDARCGRGARADYRGVRTLGADDRVAPATLPGVALDGAALLPGA
jgi:hypothetical protein